MPLRRTAVAALVVAVVLVLLLMRREPGPKPTASPVARTSSWVVARKPLPVFRPQGQSPVTPEAPDGAGALEVRVVDITGGTIPGARVLAEEDQRQLGITGPDGKLSLDLDRQHLPRSGRLTVSAEGYGQRGAAYLAGTPVVVKLVPESRVAGLVVERDTGVPAPGLTVLCGSQRTRSDEQGRFSCGDLGPGPVAIQAFGRGLQGTLPRPLAVSIATVVTDVRLEVTRTAFSVRGRVKSKGRPLPDADVEIGGRRATSEDGGRYVVADLPPGTYEVGVGFGPHTVSQPKPIVVSDRDVEADLEVGEYFTLLVEVVDTAGKPVERQDVSLWQSMEHVSIESIEETNAAGRARFSGWVSDEAELRTPLATRQKVDLRKAPPGPVRLVLPQHGRLQGRVRAPAGTSVADRQVCAHREGQSDDCIDTGPDGSFIFGVVLPGPYTIEVRSVGGTLGLVGAPPTTAATVRAGATTEVVLDVPADDGVLAGRVIDARGAPVEDALVIYALQGVRRYSLGTRGLGGGLDATVTDNLGRFRFTGVRPNQRYELEAFTRSGRHGKSDAAGLESVVRLPD